MGPVAQVVFLADYTEPGRVGKAFHQIRQALKQAECSPKGLYGAIVMACDESIKYVLSKGQVLHSAVLETRNSF